MKKTYKNPTLTVVKIQPAQFIATSLDLVNQDAGKSMGRESSFSDWEDEQLIIE